MKDFWHVVKSSNTLIYCLKNKQGESHAYLPVLVRKHRFEPI